MKIVIADHRKYNFASRSLKEAKSAAKHGHTVYWIGLSDTNVTFIDKTDGVIFYQIGKNEHNNFFLKIFSLLLINYYFTKVLKEIEFDILHIHDVKLFFIYLYGKIKKKKIIYDAHEIHYFKREKKSFRNYILNRFTLIVEKIILRLSTVNIQTNEERAFLFSKIHKTSKPVVIDNYDLPVINHSNNGIRKALGLQKFKKIIVMSGYISIGWLWAPDQVIISLKNTPQEIVFCMLGFYSDDTKNYLVNLARSLHLEERIFFLPAVKPHEVAQFISSADAAIVPIKSNSMNSLYSSPNKLYQSIAAGLPILASENRHLKKIILDCPIGHIGELFNVESTLSISSAINKLFSNYNFYKTNTMKASKEIFNWEIEFTKLNHIYNNI